MQESRHINIREGVPLAQYTSFQVGGPARYMVEANHECDVQDALEFASSHGIPMFVLGGGTNILVSDSGFPGLVLRIALHGITREGIDTVVAAAGEDWDLLVRSCVEENLAGIECMSGIPGTVGGTPIQNVGAYGAEASDVIASVRVLDRRSRRIGVLDRSECRFAYRTSIFNTTERDRFIILSVTYMLRPGGAPQIRHADLESAFARRAHPPTLAEVRSAVLQIRARKGMLIRKGDPNSFSAGSFFKNPTVDGATLSRIEEAARCSGCLHNGETIPQFQAEGGMLKLPAAWLVERSGFPKGYRTGRVGLSDKHALAIVNCGGATAGDILALMQEIQACVRKGFGIELVPEPALVGFD